MAYKLVPTLPLAEHPEWLLEVRGNGEPRLARTGANDAVNPAAFRRLLTDSMPLLLLEAIAFWVPPSRRQQGRAWASTRSRPYSCG